MEYSYDQILALIVENNPSAVYEQLSKHGLVQYDGQNPFVMTPLNVQGLIQQSNDRFMAQKILTVPLRYDGLHANELKAYYTLKGHTPPGEMPVQKMVATPTNTAPNYQVEKRAKQPAKLIPDHPFWQKVFVGFAIFGLFAFAACANKVFNKIS